MSGDYDRSYRFEFEDEMYVELAYATTGHKMTLVNTVGKTAVLRDGSGTILFGSGIAADCNAEGTYPC